MLRLLPVAFLALGACVDGYDEQGYSEQTRLQYQVGEQLMNDCNERGQRCVEWYEFRKEFQSEVGNLTTFERSLARYKAATGS